MIGERVDIASGPRSPSSRRGTFGGPWPPSIWNPRAADRRAATLTEIAIDCDYNEVRQFIYDNAFYWLDEFHLDGLRFDMTLYIRTVDGSSSGQDLPDGWSLTQWINRDISGRFPGRITIAEDLRDNEWLTKPTDAVATSPAAMF